MWTRVIFKGAVQGVGFRPAVYRTASAMGIDGCVWNFGGGVETLLKCGRDTAARFVDAVRASLPQIAVVDSVEISESGFAEDLTGFHILGSDSSGAMPRVRVSPDVAICAECLADMRSPGRRKDYFLTNCTNCGPRFSIVRSLPYDRPATTMATFEMCPGCAREYSSPADRRFHAQPIACNDCGPAYRHDSPDGGSITDNHDIVVETARLLAGGAIVMVKGIGGYNLLCDACNEQAVAALRALKHRPAKPFAVMAATMDAVRQIAVTDTVEEAALRSWRAPIVILRTKPGANLAPSVAPGCSTVGVMLPYMGFHHALLKCPQTPRVLVVTSANLHGMPIMADDREAAAYARQCGLPLVWHNRQIANRLDDSVVRIVDGVPSVVRRSRGYVPEPLAAGMDVDGIAALGADISGAWAFGIGGDIVQSQYIGSLESAEGCDFMRESVRALGGIYNLKPKTIAVDAHPAYASSAIGREWAARCGAQIVEVWHHHAHALSVMAEHGLDGEVLAVVLDGTGAGPDNTVWGSELLRCDRRGFCRLAHGDYFSLPGGDAASREPWRMAVAVLTELFGSCERLPLPLVRAVGEAKVRLLSQMISAGVNSPRGCGAGRVWDAVAALLGLTYVNNYESAAPILLENAALDFSEEQPYPLDTVNPLSLKPVVSAILDDMEAGVPTGRIAARFHSSYALAWANAVVNAATATGLRRVVLGGGVMVNQLFAGKLAEFLRRAGLEVYRPVKVPPGDAGIAVGQMIYAAQFTEPKQNIQSHA